MILSDDSVDGPNVSAFINSNRWLRKVMMVPSSENCLKSNRRQFEARNCQLKGRIGEKLEKVEKNRGGVGSDYKPSK